MAGKTALILVFGLAGGFGAPLEQPTDDEVILSDASPLPLEINNTSIAETPKRTRHLTPEEKDEAQVECESLCGLCKLFGKVLNGSCKCLDNNGSDAKCTIHVDENIGELVWNKDGFDKDTIFDVKMGGDQTIWGKRGERCLLTSSRSHGVLQNMLGRDLKDMTTEERLAEFRNRVDALRRKPSFESDKTKPGVIEPTYLPDRDSAPLFILPVSPFSSKNVGEKLQKGGKESLEAGEESEYDKIVGEETPSGVTGSSCGLASLPKGLMIPPSPVRRSVAGIPDSTEKSTYSGIKLPTQFLALTKIKERMVDIDKLPDYDGDRPTEKEKQFLIFPKLPTSVTSMTVKKRPLTSIELPRATPIPTPAVPTPSQITVRDDKIIQSDIAQNSLNLTIVPYHKEDYVKLSETVPMQNIHQYEKEGPIMEGIIAIPKHIKINM